MKLYHFAEADVRKDLLNVLAEGQRPGATIVRHACRCGCGSGVQYARDERALWVASETNSVPELHIIGLASHADVEAFVEGLCRAGMSKSAAQKERDILLALFREGAS